MTGATTSSSPKSGLASGNMDLCVQSKWPARSFRSLRELHLQLEGLDRAAPCRNVGSEGYKDVAILERAWSQETGRSRPSLPRWTDADTFGYDYFGTIALFGNHQQRLYLTHNHGFSHLVLIYPEVCCRTGWFSIYLHMAPVVRTKHVGKSHIGESSPGTSSPGTSSPERSSPERSSPERSTIGSSTSLSVWQSTNSSLFRRYSSIDFVMPDLLDPHREQGNLGEGVQDFGSPHY